MKAGKQLNGTKFVCGYLFGSKLKAKGQNGGMLPGGNERNVICKGEFCWMLEDDLGRCLKWLSARSHSFCVAVGPNLRFQTGTYIAVK